MLESRAEVTALWGRVKELESILDRILPKLYVSDSGDVLLDPNCNGAPISPDELKKFCKVWLGERDDG